MLLSLWTYLVLNTSNCTCMMLSLYLPVLLYSNDVSPSKVFKVRHPYPLLAPVVLFSLAHICGLCLCLFSALVCDLLPRRLFHGSPKAHCQKSISVTFLTSTAWRTLGLLSAFPTLVGGQQWSLGATFLSSEGNWLWELVSPRIHASPPTLWSVLPTSRGLAESVLNLGQPRSSGLE